MRTILFTLFAIAIFGACMREDEDKPEPGGCEGDGKVVLSFTDDYSIGTRAYTDSIATTAEKKVNSAKLFIFKQDGSKLFDRLMTSSEVTSLVGSSVTIVVPGMTASTSYNYYMIINHGDVTAANLSALQGITDNDITSYNGPWASVNDAAANPLRSGGFVMTGNTAQSTTSDLSQTQSVGITMKRITAKVDIKTTVSTSAFGTGSGQQYPGTITVDSAQISRTQVSTPLILGTPTTSTGTQTLKQVPNVATANSVFNNRFYIFENGTLTSGSRVLLTLYATYTNSGISNPVIYTAELTGTGTNGSFVRNGAYTVNVTLTGLSGTSLTITITLSNWEKVVTQSPNLGS